MLVVEVYDGIVVLLVGGPVLEEGRVVADNGLGWK